MIVSESGILRRLQCRSCPILRCTWMQPWTWQVPESWLAWSPEPVLNNPALKGKTIMQGKMHAVYTAQPFFAIAPGNGILFFCTKLEEEACGADLCQSSGDIPGMKGHPSHRGILCTFFRAFAWLWHCFHWLIKPSPKLAKAVARTKYHKTLPWIWNLKLSYPISHYGGWSSSARLPPLHDWNIHKHVEMWRYSE